MSSQVDALLAAMSVQDKAGQLNQRLHGWTALRRTGDGFEVTESAREEIERWGGLGALYGLFRADAWSGQHWGNGIRPEERADAAAALQEAVLAASPHRTGTLLVEEAPLGHQALGGTVLPVNLNLASTWDLARVREAAHRVGSELSASGVHIALVSALDVLRDPRWGRAEECFGESAMLAAELTHAVVDGMQGPGRSRIGTGGVAVVLKHLAAQGEAVGGRNGQSAHLGPHDLHEIHLAPAEAGIGAGALGFMAAYNDIDGVPCCANPELLTGYLRTHHGFDGIVMADGLAIDRLVDMTGDLAEAARAALLAGIDLSLWDEAFTLLPRLAEEDGDVAAALDVACRRVLNLKERFGLLDVRAPAEETPQRESLTLTSATAVTSDSSRELAARSLVLLTNNAGALPLNPSALTTLAVVGPWADDVPALLGDYVPPLPPGSAPSIGQALGAQLPEAEILISEDAVPAQLGQADAGIVVIGGTSHRPYDAEFADNGAIAGRAGQATGGEGVDLADVSLPGGQEELVRRARHHLAPGVPLIAVVVAGRPHVLTGVLESVDAVLWAGYPGPWGAEAISAVLLGEAEPTGRLPMTLPSHPSVVPVRHDDRQDATGVYLDVAEPVLFPVGHGLEYQKVEVAELRLDVGAEQVVVAVRVRNPGQRPTETVLPVFAHRRGGLRVPRRQELLAFRRIALAAGESVEVTWSIPASRFFAGTSPASTTAVTVRGLSATAFPRPPAG